VLARFVGLALAEGDAVGAFRLAGAVARLTESWPDRLSPAETEPPEQYLETASEALSPAARQAAWAEGAAMSLGQAVDYALHRGSRDGNVPERTGGLTPRELEVAGLVARGLTNREIAAELVISGGTAKRHVENILTKLGMASRRELRLWQTQQEPAATVAGPNVVPLRRTSQSDSAASQARSALRDR